MQIVIIKSGLLDICGFLRGGDPIRRSVCPPLRTCARVGAIDARDAMWYFSIILEMILIAASVAENARSLGERKDAPLG